MRGEELRRNMGRDRTNWADSVPRRVNLRSLSACASCSCRNALARLMCLRRREVGNSRQLRRVVVSSGGPPRRRATRCCLSLRMLKLIDLSGVAFRVLCGCMTLAKRVFPTPDSPMITRGSELAASSGICARSFVNAGLRPMRSREVSVEVQMGLAR